MKNNFLSKAMDWVELIEIFGKCCLMFWWKIKSRGILWLPLTVEDKTPFDANYPISTHLSHSRIEPSHNEPAPYRQYIWLALIGAEPIRQAWWSQKKGWEGRWDQGDVLCMG